MALVDRDISEAHYSLRECAKQLVLLEDHLAHPNKDCPDCIHKHGLTAEAFAEEAATLHGANIFPGVSDLPGKIRAASTHAEYRDLRKTLTGDLRARGLGLILNQEGLVAATSPFLSATDLRQNQVVVNQDSGGGCPSGYRSFTYTRAPNPARDLLRCIRESVSPIAPTFAEGTPGEPAGASCPSGMVEYAPHARTDHTPPYWRVCKAPADLAQDQVVNPGYVLHAPMCERVSGRGDAAVWKNPATGWEGNHADDDAECNWGGQQVAVVTEPCPPGFSLVPGVPGIAQGAAKNTCEMTNAYWRDVFMAEWFKAVPGARMDAPPGFTAPPEATQPVDDPTIEEQFGEAPTPPSVATKGSGVSTAAIVIGVALLGAFVFGGKR